MEIIASHGYILLALACCFGLFMAWGIGANDLSLYRLYFSDLNQHFILISFYILSNQGF